MDKYGKNALESLRQMIEDGERSGAAKYSHADLIAELNEEALAQEIEQRVAAYDRGEIPTFPAEEIFVEAKKLSE